MGFQLTTPGIPDPSQGDLVTKSEFARQLDVRPARVTQLIQQGLPVTETGKIPSRLAHDWVAANIRRRHKPEAQPAESDRARLDRLKADQAELELERLRGNMLDRAEAEKAIFERARAERDAHVAFVARVAPVIAAEIGADPAALFSALDREMRAHLVDLSETPVKDLSQ